MRAARILLIAMLGLSAGRAAAQTISITYRGATNLGTTTTDQSNASFTVAGLSGITYLGGNDFIAAMDNSNKLVKLEIQFNTDGSVNTANYNGGLSLADLRDYEGIAYTNAARNSVYLSEEGTPAVHEYSLADGSKLQSLLTPLVYLPNHLRPNFGFESLATGPSGMWTANEEALTIDGDRSTTAIGSTIRLLHYTVNGNTGTADKQYAYVTDPIHQDYNDADRSTSRSGLSDLVELPDGRLLALERSFALSGPLNVLSSFRSSIYEISTTGATDISGAAFDAGLIGQSYTAANKQLLWSHTGIDIMNLEGLVLGPQLGPNRFAMIGVVDNNGNAALSNRLIAFEIVVPEPGSAGAVTGAMMLLIKRRR